MRMLDLFSGSGSASRAAAVRGWDVVRVDNGEGTAADVRADLATWSTSESFDLVWASPPCTQLSTAGRNRNVEAGLVLVDAALRVIRAVRPRWWVLENVHGATRAIASRIGPPVACYGSFYLWGVFPPFEAQVLRDKTKLSGRRRAERRAAIPWAIADGLVRACEALALELPRPRLELPPSSPRAIVDQAPAGARAGPGPGPGARRLKYDRRRAAREAIRAREKAELARLRLELGAAKERRKRLVKEARQLCRRGRLTLRAKIRAEREALKLKAEASRKAERAACRARKLVARSSGARSVAAVKQAIIAERRAHAAQRLQAGEAKRRTAAEGARENADAVLRDIPDDLHVVWSSVGRRIKGSTAHQRAERFMHWAYENPGEVVALQQADADRDIARLVREHQAATKKSRLRKTKAEIERELQAVPF